MTQKIPEEPRFVRNITSLQKILAGVVVTMGLVVWITGWDAVINIFKPDYVKALILLRVVIASCALIITSVVGYQQIGLVLKYAIDVYEFYKTLTEIKKAKDKYKE